MGDFTHLHVHSHYSLLDGLGKLEGLLQRTKETGMDALAVTDHGVMYGVVEFVKMADKAGIKPIIGVEAYLAPNGHAQKRGRIDGNPRHLTLLAANEVGYKNLIKLTTEAHLKGYYYKPRIDYELLQQYSEGVIVLSGCLNGDIAHAILEKRPDDVRRLIEWHLNVFGRDRFFLEVQDHPNIPEQGVLNAALFDLAREYKAGLVATGDSHYVHKDDAHAHDVLLCVQTGTTVQDPKRLKMSNEDFSLKDPQAMKEAWKDHPEAIDNTMRIAEMCNVKIEFGVNHLPRFPLPRGTSAEEMLRKKCEEGLKMRYGSNWPAEANERLNYELGVMEQTGFSSYFLIVADFVNWAKQQGILVGPGRGSAAGSLVSYLMNITNLDPLKYNLLFERFLNPQRVSMPDIDLDFADDRRGEVITYVRQKYGDERVAQIITFGTMAARASVRDAGRALGFPYSFCDQVAKAIPPMTDFAEALKSSEELKNLYNGDPQAKRLIDTARKLEGVCRHASTHAAGVVITDEPLTEYVPLQLSPASDNEHDTVTQFEMTSIEALGLLKVDFLGLKNLTIIQNALKRIQKRFDVDIDIDELPLGDEKTYLLLKSGVTTGVFQLESSGMKRYLKELRPTEFEDIISMVALYRPGPMDSIPDFIAAKHGRKRITYLHPILEPILKATYGIIVTQDQVLQIAREFAGFSYAEADILRKAVGKKIQSLLDEQRQKFIQGAAEAKSIDKTTAQKVWDFIEPFARYGFNRAHAACYAMIAYQTAYLKAHYPAEFMAALLTSDEGDIDRAAIEVSEALSMGLKILPPDVNESYETFTVVQTPEGSDAIRFGLGAVKNVGHNIVSALIAEREKSGRFKDLGDIFSRMDCKDFNRKSVESLARAGAFDCLAERQLILTNAEKLLDFNRALRKERETGQKGLFGAEATPAIKMELDQVAAAAKDERLKWEKELLGMYVSEHPLTEYRQELQKIATDLNELKGLSSQQVVRVAGVIVRLSKIITKSGQPMIFATLEDLTGKAEVLVFPSLLKNTMEMWGDGASVVVEGKISDKDGEAKVLADKAWPLNKETLAHFSAAPRAARKAIPSEPAATRAIGIHLPGNFPRESVLLLKQLLDQFNTPQGVPVEIVIARQGTMQRQTTVYRLSPTPETLAAVKQVAGQESLKLRS